ncbi:MAG: Ni-sirohydrochlorin a,c-diamide reductive cyclase catalytic subunit [Methanobrevibacter sp.]|jgi:putative methanogenesis marker 13 metalloprotein|nr:Ni-sirohydrochlorin a,c-diamide reductive cyclase catalytic subunit [Candidatus Methanoflexus mossambicus]
MHPRPSPIAASLYTLRDLNADVIILHGPHGCCFRTGRLLEGDGVRVLTTAMAENDFVFGASEKLTSTLKKADEMFHPKLVGVVGTCASMIIGENLKESVEDANIDGIVLPVESHGGFGEGDNTEGAIAVLESAVKYNVLDSNEANRQIKMLKLATQIEKSRGMAKGKYIKPNFGDNKEKVAKIILKAIGDGKKIAFILNAKKETSYLFADFLNIDYNLFSDNLNIGSNDNNLNYINNDNNLNTLNKPVILANLDTEIGLPRIRNHAQNILSELNLNGIEIDYITGGLDEYPVTGDKALELIKNNNFDLIIVAGVPHAFKIEELDKNIISIAITDGPRLVEPLKELGYDYVIAELDAHSKTLGVDHIVDSDFGTMIRTVIEWESENDDN